MHQISFQPGHNTALMCIPVLCSWALFTDWDRFALAFITGILYFSFFSRLSICYCSCIFHPCSLLPHFPLLPFSAPPPVKIPLREMILDRPIYVWLHLDGRCQVWSSNVSYAKTVVAVGISQSILGACASATDSSSTNSYLCRRANLLHAVQDVYCPSAMKQLSSLAFVKISHYIGLGIHGSCPWTLPIEIWEPGPPHRAVGCAYGCRESITPAMHVVIHWSIYC